MSLCFHENYEIFCCSSVKNTIGSLIGIELSSSVKNTIGSLIGIELNQSVALGGIVIFTKMILPIQEHGICVHLFVYF